MKTQLLNIGLLSVLAGCGYADERTTAVVAKEVVYGADDRDDVYEVVRPQITARAIRSTAAIIPPHEIDATDPWNVVLRPSTLGVNENLCLGERFAHDPTAASCTATLIADDVVVTHGDCVRSQADCANARFVFNYY